MKDPKDRLKRIVEKSDFIQKWKEFGVVKEIIELEDAFDQKLDSTKEEFDQKISEESQELDSKIENLRTTNKEDVTKITEDIDVLEKNLREEISTKLDKSEYKELDEESVIERLYGKIVIPAPIPGERGRDGRDGRDGLDAIFDEESMLERFLSRVPNVEFDFSGEDIVSKINELPTDVDDLKIDASHIKNLYEYVRSNPNGGGWRNLFQLHDVTINNPTNTQILAYDSSTKQWENSSLVSLISGGLPNEVLFINSVGTAVISDPDFKYFQNEEYLYIQTRNPTDKGAVYLEVRDGETVTTYLSSKYDLTTTYLLYNAFDGGISANIGSLGSDNTALYLKVDTNDTAWNRIVSMDFNDYIRNPAYYTGGSADILFSTPGTGKFQILNESNGENRLWVDNTNLYFGDKTAVNTGAYFSFEADFYFTFWGFTGYRAMDIDLSSFSTMIGDLDGLVNGGIVIMDNLGTLNDYGVGLNVGYPTTQVGIPGYLAMASVFNIHPNTGLTSLKAGDSASLLAKAGGKVHCNTTSVGNVGTGEDDLMTYSVPAKMLNSDKESLHGTASGTIANTANAKRLRFKFGGTTVLDTGAAGIPISTAISWVLHFEIIRTGATTQKCNATLTTDNATIPVISKYTTASETLSSAVTLKLTGEATSNNDIVEETLQVYWQPAV